MFNFPDSPTNGQQTTAPSGVVYTWDGVKWVPASVPAALIGYASLPASVRQAPVTFPFAGKPTAGARVNVPIAMAVTVAAALAGSAAYAGTTTTADATVTVNRVSAGVTTALGSVVFHSGATAPTYAGAGGSLAVGDILQVIAALTQDATLADFGVTVMCLRT